MIPERILNKGSMSMIPDKIPRYHEETADKLLTESCPHFIINPFAAMTPLENNQQKVFFFPLAPEWISSKHTVFFQSTLY